MSKELELLRLERDNLRKQLAAVDMTNQMLAVELIQARELQDIAIDMLNKAEAENKCLKIALDLACKGLENTLQRSGVDRYAQVG